MPGARRPPSDRRHRHVLQRGQLGKGRTNLFCAQIPAAPGERRPASSPRRRTPLAVLIGARRAGDQAERCLPAPSGPMTPRISPASSTEVHAVTAFIRRSSCTGPRRQRVIVAGKPQKTTSHYATSPPGAPGPLGFASLPFPSPSRHSPLLLLFAASTPGRRAPHPQEQPVSADRPQQEMKSASTREADKGRE